MRGCLSLPARLLSLALLVLAGYVAWSYRAEIRRQIHRWTADSPAPATAHVPAAAARSHAAEAKAVMQRVEALRAGTADSVVLSADELASLAAQLAAKVVPGALDSVEVRLERDDIEIRARVDTHKVPVSLGPLSTVVREHEYVEAGGRLMFRRAGLAEWEIERVRVRGLPVPMSLLRQQIRRFAPGAASSTVPVALPSSVSGLRVTAEGVTLYGRTRPVGSQ